MIITLIYRIKINFILIAICIPLEIAQFIVQYYSKSFSTQDQLTPNFWLNAVHGVFIYTLYYQVCILGPIDMAKVWLLRTNQKFIGIYFCILCGVSHCFQSLFFEILIKYFVTTNQQVIEEESYGKEFFIVQKSLELFCCVIAMLAIWKLLKDETKEIEWSSRQHHDHNDNSQMIDGTKKFSMNMNRQQQNMNSKSRFVSYESSEDERYEHSSPKAQTHLLYKRKTTTGIHYDKKFTK